MVHVLIMYLKNIILKNIIVIIDSKQLLGDFSIIFPSFISSIFTKNNDAIKIEYSLSFNLLITTISPISPLCIKHPINIVTKA